MKTLIKGLGIVAFFAGVLIGCTTPGATGTNLITNGDAEASAGSANGSPVTTPDWTISGEASAIKYGITGFPSATDPGPEDRGANFFFGGNAADSSLAQTIDVSASASSIDGGAVTYTLSGWLGGFSNQTDNATLTAAFQDSSGATLGVATIGPVTPADRNNKTGLLQRTTSGSVPTGTRSVQVILQMTRENGTANDGYGDNLSLVFSGT